MYSYRKTLSTVSFVLLAATLVAVLGLNTAYADSGMSITVSAVDKGTTINVSGMTDRSNDVIIQVFAPNGNLVTIDQVPVTGDKFDVKVKTGGNLWKQDGMYTITARQGDASVYNLSVQVKITSGMTVETTVSESSITVDASTGQEIVSITESTTGLSISANAIEGSTTIDISGQTDTTINDVTLTITSPNGNIVSIDQISPNIDGSFMASITTGGPLWKQDGMYTITARQGSGSLYQDSTQVEIVDGAVIPEFGTIAAMILAVAIVSIIVVSAKTRLSLVPRY